MPVQEGDQVLLPNGPQDAERVATKLHATKTGKNRGARAWDKNAVLKLLKNPIPAGLITSGGQVYDGEHKAIIDRGLYDRVQVLLTEKNGGRTWKPGRNTEYLLTGILRCARCGQAFTPASARRGDRVHRYYRCSTRVKKGKEACASGPLSARAIEGFVIDRMREAIADGKLAEDVAQATKLRLEGQRGKLEDERATLPGKIASLATEGKRLVATASNVTGAGRRLLDAKLQETGDQLGLLEARLAEVQRRLALLEDVEIQTRWVEQCLANFDKVWDTLSTENRSRLVHALVQRVEVDEPSGDVRAYLVSLAGEPDEKTGPSEVAA